MNNKFDLEKALRILKSQKITKGEVAKTTGYESTYLSKMISGERPLTEQFYTIFMKEYGKYLNDIDLVIEDPEKELLISNTRIESKMDTMALLLTAVLDVLSEDQKVKVAKVLNKADFEGNEGFKAFIEASKKRVESRIRKSQQREA
jgi:hypothetical protein